MVVEWFLPSISTLLKTKLSINTKFNVINPPLPPEKLTEKSMIMNFAKNILEKAVFQRKRYVYSDLMIFSNPAVNFSLANFTKGLLMFSTSMKLVD